MCSGREGRESNTSRALWAASILSRMLNERIVATGAEETEWGAVEEVRVADIIEQKEMKSDSELELRKMR